MEKANKAKIKDKDSSMSIEDRKLQIQRQLEQAYKKREEYNALIFKCQGALELLENLEEGSD